MGEYNEVVQIRYNSNLPEIFMRDKTLWDQFAAFTSKPMGAGGAAGGDPFANMVKSAGMLKNELGPINSNAFLSGFKMSVKDADGSLQSISMSAQKAGSSFKGAHSDVLKFASSIALGMGISMAFSAVLDTLAKGLQGVWAQIVQVSDATAKYGAISGQSRGEVSGAITGQAIAGAKYGISFKEVTEGEVLRARMGISEQDADDARKMAQIWGVDYNEALREVYQTRQKLNNENIKGFQIDDMTATIYARTGNTFEQAGDSIQKAITTYRELGISVEQTAMVISKSTDILELNSDAAGDTIIQLTSNLQKNKDSLAKYGIGGTTNKELILSAYQATRRMIAEGDSEGLSRLKMAVGEGMMNPTAFKAKWVDFITTVGEAMSESGVAMSNADKQLAETTNSISGRQKQLQASWDALVASAVGFGEKMGIMQAFTDSIYGASIAMQELAKEINAITAPEALEGVTEYLNSFIKATGVSVKKEDVAAGWSGALASAGGIFGIWGQQARTGQMGGASKTNIGTSGLDNLAGGTGRGGAATPTLEGFLELPGGISAKKFEAEYKKQLAYLESIGYTETKFKTNVALTDPRGRMVGGPSSYGEQATKMAMDELKRSMEYSIAEVPEKMTTTEFKSRIKAEEERLSGIKEYAATREYNLKTYYFYDNALKRWDSIQATSDEISAATKDTAKSLKEARGVFNLPADAMGQIRVTLSALSNNIVRATDLSTGDTGDGYGVGGDGSGGSTGKHARWASAGGAQGPRTPRDDEKPHTKRDLVLREFIAASLNPSALRATWEKADLSALLAKMNSNPTVNITNRIQVTIDGANVAGAVETRQQNEMSKRRRSAKGAVVAQ